MGAIVPLAGDVKVELEEILIQEFAIHKSGFGAVGGELLLDRRRGCRGSAADHQSCSREESHVCRGVICVGGAADRLVVPRRSRGSV